MINVGTFSKVMFGALRLGYMVLPAALCGDFLNAKYLSDFSNPAIERAALAGFMESCGFDRHLRCMTKEMKARRRELLSGLRQHAGTRVQITVWLPDCRHGQVDAMNHRGRAK